MLTDGISFRPLPSTGFFLSYSESNLRLLHRFLHDVEHQMSLLNTLEKF